MDKALMDFIADNEELSTVFWLSRERQCRVLTRIGVRILRGIMSCVLKAHQAGFAYGGEFTEEDMRVMGVVRINSDGVPGPIVPESAFVCIHGKKAKELGDSTQRDDYLKLARIIAKVFQPPDGEYPLHVRKIHTTVTSLAAKGAMSVETRIQLLQAFEAMIDPLVMATMWWNLVRFQSTLGPPQCPKRRLFESTLNSKVTPRFPNWRQCMVTHNDFRYAFGIGNRQKPYDDDEAAELLRFTRNWFTHATEENGVTAADIPLLDYYFSHCFGDFMADVLTVLYDQQSLSSHLTNALVPQSF